MNTVSPGRYTPRSVNTAASSSPGFRYDIPPRSSPWSTHERPRSMYDKSPFSSAVTTYGSAVSRSAHSSCTRPRASVTPRASTWLLRASTDTAAPAAGAAVRSEFTQTSAPPENIRAAIPRSVTTIRRLSPLACSASTSSW